MSPGQGFLDKMENTLPFHLRSVHDGETQHKELAQVLKHSQIEKENLDQKPREIMETKLSRYDEVNQLNKTGDRFQVQISRNSSEKKYYRDRIGPIPQIVQAWRNAKLDWHDLLPKHMSTWERYHEKKGLRLLVSKEEQVTNYLTRFTESGLADAYGREHGPLLAYSGCNKLQSDCMIHSKDACKTNGLCMWNPKKGICIDYDYASPYGEQEEDELPNGRVLQCPAGGKRGVPNAKGFQSKSDHDKSCKMWVDQPAVVLSLDGESQSMFYHWVSSWGSVKDIWMKELGKSRKSHIFMSDIEDILLYGYFGMITDFCWRRADQELQPIPKGLCFCDISKKIASQGGAESLKAVHEMIDRMQLQDVSPPPDKPKIGIISRRRKRFILNEYELADVAIEMGYEVVLLPLETMTYYEQIREFRSLDVLVGIHGSALDNVLFLHPGSVMIQLMPWKNTHTASFRENTRHSRVEYMEWSVPDQRHTFLHWDLFEQADKEKLERFGKKKILEGGQRRASSRETLMFWINQDIIVPVHEWRRLLLESVSKSNAKKRLNHYNFK